MDFDIDEEFEMKQFLTPEELEKEYGLRKKWQDKWRPLGLPYIKLGGYIRYHRESIENWILKHSINKDAFV